MPERQTIQRAKRDLRKGKSASTAAGEFVREEMHHIREGKHGARSTKQAIAIGLSKARRAGVPLAAQKTGRTKRGASAHEGRRSASHAALARHARTAASRRSHAARSASARKAARTRARTRR